VTGVESTGGHVSRVRFASGASIETPWVVNAAGPGAGHVASPAGVAPAGSPMRQMLFRPSLPHRWPHRFPMVIDPGGVHWRHDDPIEAGQADRIIVPFPK